LKHLSQDVNGAKTEGDGDGDRGERGIDGEGLWTQGSKIEAERRTLGRVESLHGGSDSGSRGNLGGSGSGTGADGLDMVAAF